MQASLFFIVFLLATSEYSVLLVVQVAKFYLVCLFIFEFLFCYQIWPTRV